MSNRSIRNPAAIVRKAERDRPVFAGFAFAFCEGVAKALQRPAEEAEAMLLAVKAAQPPAHCPACGQPASFAVRDPNGDWTWCCPGGCNP